MSTRSTRLIRRAGLLAATLTAALGALGSPALGGDTATATTTAGGLRLAAAASMSGVTIRNADSGYCVNGPGLDGGTVLQLGCAGWGNLTWDVVPVPSRPGLFEVVNATTGRCLEIGGWSGADGAAAMTWSCHGGTNQHWWVTRHPAGYYELKNENSNRCLDARMPTAWIPLYQWGCHGGGEQRWLIP